MIPERLDCITVDDLVRVGSCLVAAREALNRIAPGATAVDVTPDLLASLDETEADWVCLASGRSGYGFGSGDGYGSGSGDGHGYGYGYGDGDGYGDGYGYGDGDGYGDGYGYGFGSGSGYG